MMATAEYVVNPILRNSGVPDITFRVSIDYGPVTLALLGAARRFNSVVAIGTTANFASKMLANARPGEIVLGATAKLELPITWQDEFVRLALLETGWSYTLTGLPYPLYRYNGRWNQVF
jgi:class 3 adenylate cyclase